MDAGTILITGIGLAVAAGLNAYIPLLVAGLLIHFDVVSFGDPFDLLGDWPALVIIGVLLAVELVADKIPAVDTVNDVIQTVIRPASGALLFAGAAHGIDPEWSQALALVLGLATAGSVHAAKATARPVVNVATAGFGAPVVSTVEDGVSVGLSITALLAPLLALVLIVGVVWWLVVAMKRRAGRRGSGPRAGGV